MNWSLISVPMEVFAIVKTFSETIVLNDDDDDDEYDEYDEYDEDSEVV